MRDDKTTAILAAISDAGAGLCLLTSLEGRRDGFSLSFLVVSVSYLACRFGIYLWRRRGRWARRPASERPAWLSVVARTGASFVRSQHGVPYGFHGG